MGRLHVRVTWIDKLFHVALVVELQREMYAVPY